MNVLTPIVMFNSNLFNMRHIHALAPCLSGDDFAVGSLLNKEKKLQRFLSEMCIRTDGLLRI
jgi:hypothetical protein